LAALRTLYEEDPSRYDRFSHIDVIILPSCEQRDIDELEARLQFDEDIKDDYSWAAEAFTIRSKSDHYTQEELAKIYRKTPKELNQLLERLDMAEDYLERRQKEGQYHRVERAEEAFKQIQRTSRKLTDSPAKEAFLKEIAYTLIEDPAGDRVYAYIPKALSILERIRDTLATEVLQAPSAEPAPPGEIELFGNPDAEPSDQVYQQATTALMGLGESRATEVADVIKDCIEHFDREERDERRSNYVIDKVREANTALQDALGGIDESQDHSGVAAQLESIEHSVTSLRAWATAPRR
jgi:DNA repair ATPase RecN